MNELFFGLTNNERQKLLKLFKSTSLFFKKNQTILTHNNDSFIGIIIKGSLEIISIDYDGNERTIEKLSEGNIFGTNISFLTNPDLNIITKEDSKIILIEEEYILNNKFIKYPYYNKFLINLNKITNSIMKEMDKHIQLLSKKTIRERLLEYFRLLSKKQKTKYLYLPMNLSDLADYLSVDRSAMMREIKNLKEDGLINGKGKEIHINY